MPQNLVSANAGTLESSDLFVRVLPNEGQGVSIELESSVYEIYSESIYEIANDVVKKMNLKDQELGGLKVNIISTPTYFSLYNLAKFGVAW